MTSTLRAVLTAFLFFSSTAACSTNGAEGDPDGAVPDGTGGGAATGGAVGASGGVASSGGASRGGAALAGGSASSGGSEGSQDGGGTAQRTCTPRNAKPDATNTGVPEGTALTVVNGDQTFADDGATISGKDFRGFVKVTGRGITFRNCVFHGRATDRNTGLIDTQPGTDTWITDCEFAPSNPSATTDVLWIAHTTICRSNIHGGVDGVKTWDDSEIIDSYIHDMSWFASDPNQNGGETHNDGVQAWAKTRHLVLRHDNIDMSTTKSANAALQASAFDVHIEDNWLDGGGCTLNFAHGSVGGPLNEVYVVNNRFGRHSSFQCPILISTQTTLTENKGNVWVDTGTPIPPPQQHD